MDTKTLEIATTSPTIELLGHNIKKFTDTTAMGNAGYTLPLSDELAGMLSKMNRAQRRKWLREFRKKS